MRFRLPNGNLVVTDAENASILGPHFKRVYTNHRKIDWTVLDDIQQRTTMVELLPIIANRDYLLHHLRNQYPTLHLTHLRILLKDAQTKVTDNIYLAKAAWCSHQADSIHSIRHTPKSAWESIKVLAGGMSSHQKSLTVMRFKLPNGNLAVTNAENTSILGPHFERVYTNHRKIDWKVLDDIQ